ncbi:adenine nucleotide alpha hydrolases-like protein [Sodiomyces alkalinus F11]|uniref:FAD synthase n=1 Tax=Sodiomyces alkalinus (strain CBS 110278 / VKM F-3762 / F11) TaxID=1314773 RepID=A0A3N2QA73_SODAK|nr:adenine nucleotide alpha hydrolases-like protein [Sodiomyces alkalinus F11]ROT43663.1 adenine nucleotide alpha hydrolases-like protein [Sodiomyces alkalinus F11]
MTIQQDHDEHAADAAAAYEGKPSRNGYPAESKGCADAAPRSLREVCLELREKIDAFLAEEPTTPLLRDLQSRLRVSMAVTEEALERYQPEEISLSYNGGKDCLVLLLIILACLPHRFPSPSNPTGTATNPPNTSSDPAAPFPEKVQAVYIVSQHPFSEVDDFVASSAQEYHLDINRYSLPMKQGLQAYLADRPSIRAIFVGTRRTDPHGEDLKHFDPTDAGWPPFMRIHPVIDWHYVEIWAFIRHLGTPYCPLYDQGYTSLGGRRDTHPNPHLKKEGANGKEFRPAYELTDDEEERLGRDR